MKIALRPYQETLVNDTRELMKQGHKRVVILSVTGSGKTRTSAAIVESSIARGRRVLFLVAGRQLVTQALKSYTDLGIHAAPIMAGFTYDHSAPCQVGSVHTVASRLEYLDFLQPDLIVTDEAHTALGELFNRVREKYPKAFEIGLTATPKPTEVFTAMSRGPTYDALINAGHLVRPRFFSAQSADESKLKVSAGEYTESSQADAFGDFTLIGGIVEKWRQFCDGRPTVVFAPDVATSIRNTEMFNAAGIPAFHIDATTTHDVRQAAFRALRDGELLILSNYGVLSKGFDEPCISAAIFERVTKSVSVYIQAVGRALRAYPGKQDALVLDLGGNIHRFGDFTTDEVEWTLDGSRNAQQEREERLEARPKKDVTCFSCAFVYPAGPKCPNCNAVPEKAPGEAKDDSRIDAELTEVKPKARKPAQPDPGKFYAMLRYAEQSHSLGKISADHVYRERFGSWPPASLKALQPVYPSLDVARYVRSRQIAYSSRRPQQGSAHD